jgi:flagellar motility protein MotE (MotC chaperone)
MPEEQDLAASLRTGCEWIAAALADLAHAVEANASRGEGLREIARALERLAQAQERQAGALERLAGVLGERRREK